MSTHISHTFAINHIEIEIVESILRLKGLLDFLEILG